MSVYNEPLSWLKEAVDSIKAQTFSDFEFIIINDNPKCKNLEEFLACEARNDSRIRIHTNPDNIGLTKSLNIGLRLCSGKYIARMDADDIAIKTRFEKQVAFMEKHADVIVCGTNIKLFGNFQPLYVKAIFKDDVDIKGQMLFNSGFVHPTVIIRKSILDKTGIQYDESYRSAQDYKLWYDLNGLGKFANLKEKLLKYRLSNQQITSKLSNNQQNNRIKIAELFCQSYSSSSEVLQAYYKRSLAYRHPSFSKLIRISASIMTKISFKERLSLIAKAFLHLIH